MEEQFIYMAKESVVKGQVKIGQGTSIWYHATVRGDKAPIEIGEYTNVQDNAVLHVDAENPVVIGDYVTIGHGAIIHGCTVGDESLIGMGAVILNGAKIGKHCVVGAGALITQNMEVPDGSLIFGNPGKIRRVLTEEEKAYNRKNAMGYVKEAKEELEKVERKEEM